MQRHLIRHYYFVFNIIYQNEHSGLLLELKVDCINFNVRHGLANFIDRKDCLRVA